MKVSKSLIPSGIKRLVSNSVLIGWNKRRRAKVLLFQIDRERLVLARAVVIAAESVEAFFALTGEVTPAHVVALMRAKENDLIQLRTILGDTRRDSVSCKDQ